MGVNVGATRRRSLTLSKRAMPAERGFREEGDEAGEGGSESKNGAVALSHPEGCSGLLREKNLKKTKSEDAGSCRGREMLDGGETTG